MSSTTNDDWALLGFSLLEASGLPYAVDAVMLARRWGLTTDPRPGPGCELRGSLIRYDESVKGSARQRLIARGVARWALKVVGLPPSDLAEHVIVRALGCGRPQVLAPALRARG